MNGIVKNISALSIQTTGQVPTLSKGQKALLRVIRDCVQSRTPLTFDLIVRAYYDNVRKVVYEGENWHYPNGGYGRYASYIKHDIMELWNAGKMTYKYKPQIRQWFVSNIGILVIKNQLVIIPTIDLGDEEHTR
jgi:hypothetical protein